MGLQVQLTLSVYFANFLAMGVYVGCKGPLLLTLADRTGAPVAAMGAIFTSFSAGQLTIIIILNRYGTGVACTHMHAWVQYAMIHPYKPRLTAVGESVMPAACRGPGRPARRGTGHCHKGSITGRKLKIYG